MGGVVHVSYVLPDLARVVGIRQVVRCIVDGLAVPRYLSGRADS